MRRSIGRSVSRKGSLGWVSFDHVGNVGNYNDTQTKIVPPVPNITYAIIRHVLDVEQYNNVIVIWAYGLH